MALTNKQKIGQIGENIAVKHLLKLHFKILDRNYRKKCGEIDIIAEKNNVLHFIEVKTVSFNFSRAVKNVSYETFLPEENIHFWKRKRLAKTINIYLLEKRVSENKEWQIDSLSVFVDLTINKAKIRFLENITW